MKNEEGKLYEKTTYHDLPSDHQSVIDHAIEQLDYSYAPYSDFNVGAGLLLSDGKVIGGSNQENASYPLCCCAERIALYHASVGYPKQKVEVLAITARNNKMPLPIDKPIMPCGACRQVIFEYEQRYQNDIVIYLFISKEHVYKVDSVKILLPSSFDGSYL